MSKFIFIKEDKSKAVVEATSIDAAIEKTTEEDWPGGHVVSIAGRTIQWAEDEGK